MQVRMIYDRLNERAASIVESVGYDGSVEFSFADYPETKRDLQLLQRQFVGDMQSLVYSGTSAEWKRSNLLQDLVANKALKYYRAQVDGEKFKHYYQVNSDQLKAFQRRRERGLNLSAKLWNQSQVYKNSLEATISTAIEKGMSAVTLSKRISKYLNDWPSLQADYQEKFGKATNCYDCEYRSIRLARNEINIAYRTAEQERWKQFDFILGYKIKLSGSHPAKDICDDLQGDYPVEFKFTGWHPNCYAEGTDVYTNDGWKDLKDINGSEKILSLNPITRNLEWTSIIAKQCYYKKEDLVRFYNKSFDCLVTKEHQMVYVSKSNRILNCMASDFRCTQGGIYRNSQYEAKDMKTIKVGNKDVEFDTFCEFMGYYLSDGCCSIKGNGGTIYMAQKIGEPAHDKICSVISRLGYKCYIHDKIIIFSSLEWCKYLSQFGKCNTKYIPREILNASRRQIKIFLDAFIICDGHKRRNNSFMTKGGIMFIPKKDERVYFTTSKRMADELGEAILKVGHHPSFHIDSKKYLNSREHILNGRQIHANFDLHRIAECYRELSTLFKKEYVPYDGFVYDITLERNHIMYVRRNGKCFWGSNCLCYTVPIVMSEDEYWSDDRENSPNLVTAPPENFGKLVSENSERIEESRKKGTLPYWIKENPVLVEKAAISYKEKLKQNNQFFITDDIVEELHKTNWSRFDIDKYNNSALQGFNMQRFDKLMEEIGDEYQIFWSGKYVSFYENGNATFTYKGLVDGEDVELVRSFIYDGNKKIVSHDIFELPDALQGKGISKRIFKDLFSEYESMGIDRVEVLANMDVGGYCWGRYGFSAKTSEIKDLVQRRFSEGVISQNDFEEVSEILKMSGPNIRMNEIANLKCGKALLLSNKVKWRGFIDLRDKHQMEYLHDYIGLRK